MKTNRQEHSFQMLYRMMKRKLLSAATAYFRSSILYLKEEFDNGGDNP